MRRSFVFALLACAVMVLLMNASGLAGEAIQLQVQCPDRGLLSLGIYNAQGQQIRNLISAKSVSGGAQNLQWDGTTQLGLPAAPGKYYARGVWFPQPPTIDYLMKVGLSGNPPYYTDTDRGAWGGNLGAPMDICTNGKNLLAIFACVESNKTTGIQLMDLEGNIQHRFSSFFGWDIRLACAMDERNIYLVASARGKKKLFIGKYDIDSPPRGKILCDVPAGDHQIGSGLWKGEWDADVRGLAVNDGRLYVPLFLDDKLFVIDAQSGSILHEVSVDSPRGVAVHGGRIYLLSKTSLLRLNADGAPAAAPVVTGLEDPCGLAIDAKGNFYISDRGASQQVKVFSTDGKPLRQVGIAGGRPRNGIYNPAGLLDPRGLCVAPNGDVWVASSNEDFQDITVWNQRGERVKAFYNCRISAGQGRLSPDRSELINTFRDLSDSPGVTAYKIDFAKHAWEPAWRINMMQAQMQDDSVFIGYKNNNQRFAGAYPRVPYLGMDGGLVQADNGKTYLVGGDFSIWLFDPAAKQAKLASLIYTHRAHKLPDGRYEGDYDQGPNNWLTWSDLNGDGKMALDEIVLTPDVALLKDVRRITDGGCQLQPDLSLLLLAGEKAPGKTLVPDTWSLYRLPAQRVLPSGAPVYDWRDLKKVVTLQVPDWKGGDGYKDPRTMTLNGMDVEDGFLYANTAGGHTLAKVQLTGVDGSGWWASRNWRMSPMKFDLKTGQSAWLKLGSRAPGRAESGQMYYPGWGVAGAIDGMVYVPDTLGQVWAWTIDGLYLGPLYHDNSGGNVVYDANSLFIELTGAFAYKIGGRTYILAGDHGVSVHRVNIPRLTVVDGGSITLTPAMAAAAKPWDPDGPPPGKRPVYLARSIYDFSRDAQKYTRTITIDGKLDESEWDGVPVMDIFRDGKKLASVQAAFDKEKLYLAYRVQDPQPLRNDGHELPYCPFVTGSYVDFTLGRDWSSPDRAAFAEGDVRVILARITGGSAMDYQMGFWPIRKDLRKFQPPPAKLNPQQIVSPAQQRHFDDISPVPGLKFAYQISADGYSLETSVPFVSLGISPFRNPVVGFDASVGFSDPAGQMRVGAAHWAGESESTVVDRPGSAELKPQTWGTLQFDLTPVARP